MIGFSLIRPLDQPLGQRRLLGALRESLRDERFDDFRVVVAYARSGPLRRLQSDIERWREAGSTSAAIFGVDQQGTSRDALELANSLFDNVYITREPGITFHPKIYLFKGNRCARAYIGSNNLTVGGTEKNFESAVQLDLELPDDNEHLATINAAWNELLPGACAATSVLNTPNLNSLVERRLVLSERESFAARKGDADSPSVGRGQHQRSGLVVVPESPLPPAPRPLDNALATVVDREYVRGFVIQIKPHHNGEIFLSVSAAREYPEFFGLPFSGQTTPKRPGNPSYPQRSPDPVVNISVYGAPMASVLTLLRYNLNTVWYTARSEIRITASPLVGVVQDYSVMVMERSPTSGIDYEITIYLPSNPEYSDWVTACDRQMPGGGRVPRKYGWF